jgi:protein-L-isoaspartate(D-aspartate) O-methyltransferase
VTIAERCFNGAMPATVRCLARRTALVAALSVGCAVPAPHAADPETTARERMVAEQIAARGVRDPRVLAAMRRVPRHAFVPEEARPQAYDDTPVRIGHGQTASQPYIVAVMTELAAVGPRSRVLEIGTGSGYQAAVLAELADEVYTIELIGDLADRARRTLTALGYQRVHVRHGDGYRGWPEAAPFGAIVVTAAPPEVPQALLDQLAPGGRLVVPVGEREQELQVHRRTPRGIEVKRVFPVRFVPLVRP